MVSDHNLSKSVILYIYVFLLFVSTEDLSNFQVSLLLFYYLKLKHNYYSYGSCETKNVSYLIYEIFICSKAGEVHLLNVWSVQGPYRITILQSQFKDSWDDVFVLKPVQDLSVALFQFVEELLFKTNVSLFLIKLFRFVLIFFISFLTE